ncbi:1ff480a9-7ceb-4b5e-9f5a-db7132b36913 [Sclerotinia trifoliorum]|uniref:1ff480a9-7ceb-4b5e-9f5a-db7132b36913 n=1 Tax=Sclerotinia trifoliorum TaxID=28548 RepID=A0A8H2VXN6_9HELO|nr:1ff480a9-7ceb-4b5e-9f5a-db7132b36913 [Sclerotinia trifoliorum]
MEPKQTSNERFTCSICGKDSGNRKSQLRHISYCRRVKAQGGVKSRKRSCVACTKAKTQCDLRQSCSRCTTRNLSCVYEGPRTLETNVPEPVAGRLLENGTNQGGDVPLISSSSDVATSALMDVYETAITPYPLQSSDCNIQDILSLDLPGGNWDLQFSEFLPEHTGFPFLGSAPYSVQSSPRLLQTGPSPVSTNFHVGDNLPYYRMYNQPVPKAPIAFAPRKSHKSQFSLNRNYILCTLPTYPSMMLSNNSDIPPPFIHPHFNDRKALSGALGICANLVRWTSHKTEDNAVHIWRCIRMEIDRLLSDIQ